MAPDLQPTLDEIIQVRRRVAGERAALIAISGIDACGKGFLTGRLAERLQSSGFRIANINIDGWLNLPQIRFDREHPAKIFYQRAIRFDDMFEQLIFPLRDRRAVDIEMDFAEETATTLRKQRYQFTNVDVILLEGIYLLKREFQSYYDFSVWIDCSFETALDRAIARAQEGLSRQDTIEAYQTIFFPAQEIHFPRDNPKAAAATILANDSQQLKA